MIITFHHIILDGWSLSIVLNDVNRLYYQLFNEEKSYIYNNTEFSEFIQNKLTANNEKSNQYFQNLLTDFPGFSFLLYTNRKEGFETINKILTLDMKVIKNFCKKYKISLSSLFSSVWSLVVSAYTGKSDILLNKTHSGRDSKKNKLLGYLLKITRHDIKFTMMRFLQISLKIIILLILKQEKSKNFQCTKQKIFIRYWG